ncbi:MAG: hypothetical protein AAFY57_16025 [Cyanobacteria bacterium J06642_2]
MFKPVSALLLLATAMMPFAASASTIGFSTKVWKPGSIIDGQTLQGVTFGVNQSGGKHLMLFNSWCKRDPSKCSGGDSDLYAPSLGYTLIVSADNNSSNPNDRFRGGTVTLDFGEEVLFEGWTALDTQRGVTAKIYRDDVLVLQETIFTEDNGISVQDYSNFSLTADRAEFELTSAGALDKFKFTRLPSHTEFVTSDAIASVTADPVFFPDSTALASANATAAPEPMTAVGALVALGWGTRMLRKEKSEATGRADE